MGKKILKSALIFIIFAGSLYACARNYSLDCTRLESDHINCTRTEKLLGLRLGERKFEGLVRANVLSCRGYEGDTGYLVVLETTRAKNLPLAPTRSCYSGIGIHQSRENRANAINRFIENPGQKTLTLNIGIEFLNIIFLGIIFFLGIMYLRNALQEK